MSIFLLLCLTVSQQPIFLFSFYNKLAAAALSILLIRTITLCLSVHFCLFTFPANSRSTGTFKQNYGTNGRILTLPQLLHLLQIFCVWQTRHVMAFAKFFQYYSVPRSQPSKLHHIENNFIIYHL